MARKISIIHRSSANLNLKINKKYHSKIDNIKATSSSAAVIKFEYFDLFNEMLGHKSNVVPLATASSSRNQGIAWILI